MIGVNLLNNIIKAMPAYFYIEVSNRCNIRCVMCACSFKEMVWGDMSLQTFRKIKPYFHHTKRVDLYGHGEPLMNSHFLQMLEETKYMGARVNFNTNGTLIDEKNASFFVGVNLDSLVFSIDAAQKETFEKIRRGADFEKVLKGIENINYEKKRQSKIKPELIFETVIMLDNLEELPDLVYLAKKLEIKEIVVVHLTAHSLKMREQTLFSKPELAASYFAKAKTIAAASGVRLNLPPLERKETKPFYSRCPEPWQTAYIRWNGEVKPCCNTERVMGNLNEESFSRIWRGDNYRLLRNQIRTDNPPQDCLNCYYQFIK